MTTTNYTVQTLCVDCREETEGSVYIMYKTVVGEEMEEKGERKWGYLYDMKWATKLVKRGTKLEPGMKVRESKR